MKLVNALIQFLKQKGTDKQKDTPENVCPNCWGRTEYSGNFYEAVKNNNVDINSSESNVGWVQEYANKHLSEIELVHSDNGQVCNKCKITYRPAL